mgnify:CR=1 FL=1
MANKELVIKIDEKYFEYIHKAVEVDCTAPPYFVVQNLWESVLNGTPLPKGHGRIADMDAAIKCIKEVEGEDAIWAISLIEWACSKRTIIEADKEQEDGRNN